MKNRQRKIAGLLLACMMTCLPVSQAYAQTDYDAAAGVEEQVLFPQDSLIGISGGVLLDGEASAADESGAWKNNDEAKVYTADSMDDGTIAITMAGYELLVEHGTAKTDKEDDRFHHYQYLDWEKPDKPTDRVYYAKDETVKLIADAPAEGMEFKGWKCDTEGVTIADPSSAETTLTMINKKVTVTAEYQEKQPEETPAPEETNAPEETSAPEEISVPEETNAPEETSAPEEIDVPEETNVPESGAEQETMPTDPAGESTQQPESGDLIIIGNEEETAPAVYTVTVNDGTFSGNLLPGAQITITANEPAEGYQFAGWYVESMNVSPEDLMAVTTSFTMPESSVIINATYEEKTPETSEPETTAPETTAPETSEPETTATETTAPETSEPETAAPETSAPETAAPETSAPETSEPETTAPETDAPQTDANVEKYTLTVENEGIGSGEYAAGEQVTVEAFSETGDGQVFESWKSSSENIDLSESTQEVMTFTMPAEPVTLTPTYTTQYALTIADVDNVTAVLPDSPEQTNLTQLAAGTKVKVTAKDRSAEGLKFTSWVFEKEDGTAMDISYEADPAALSAVFAMPEEALTVKAVYETAVTYQVKVSNGLVTDPATGVTGTQMICDPSTKITVTANPSPTGQAFSHWVINDGTFDLGDAAYSQKIELTVDQTLNILAVYEGIEYTVNVEDGYSDYEECVGGTAVTITADEAPEGYEFDYWTVDSENASLADAYSEVTTFTMPMADVTVSANYKQVAFKLTVENGSSADEYYYAGDEVTVKSNYPASGRVFGKWEAASGNVSFADASRWKTTFTMPASDVKVRAVYKDGPSVNDNVILDLVQGGEYYVGDTVKFTASGAGMKNDNPNPGDYRYRPSGYQIGNVSGTLQSPYSVSMAINKTGEYTLKTTYNKEIFDGNSWREDGTADAKSVTFRVVTKAAGVATGDETPIAAVIALAAVSCIVFLILLVVFLRRRKK